MAEAPARPDEAVADLYRHLLGGQAQAAVFPRGCSEPTDMHASASEGGEQGAAGFLKAPGGFRRHFLIGRAEAEGRGQPAEWRRPLLEVLRPLLDTGSMERVLSIGEDGERLPPVVGHFGTLQTVLAIIKSFVGSAVTFMPAAFSEGGWLFSTGALLAIGLASAHCIWLLVDCRARTGATDFGAIAARAAGPAGTLAVQVSIVISQFGFCTSYIIFVNKVLGALFAVPSLHTTLAQACVLVPLGLVRSLHNLEYPILVADALVFFGIAAILCYNLRYLGERGVAPGVESFRPGTCGLFIGTTVFTFEGIPLMLPVQASMREPERFVPLFLAVITGIMLLYVAFGLLGYADYGSGVQATALNNLPDGDLLADSVKVAYGLALMLTMPLMFVPATRIVELWIFGVAGKGERKWSKNLLRTSEVVAFSAVALFGGAYFEEFLALVGALCCAPVAFIYPAWFHLRLCSSCWLSKAVDCFYVACGLAVVAFVLCQVLLPQAGG